MECAVIGHGMLGRVLARLLDAAGHEPAVWDFPDIDITDPDSIKSHLEPRSLEVVFNCSAYTQVDNAETEAEAAFAVNAAGPGLLAAACAARNILLVHVSTDYVFDGQPPAAGGLRAYSETDPTNPIGVYGRSKFEGERGVLQNCPRSLIVRTQWLYGLNGVNFVATMQRLMNERDQLKVVNDQTGSPTYTKELAGALSALAELTLAGRAQPGIYHFANAGACTWFEFALAIRGALAECGCEPRCSRIDPCTTAEFPRPAPRPPFSVLDTSKVAALLGPIRSWEESLKEFVHSELCPEAAQTCS